MLQSVFETAYITYMFEEVNNPVIGKIPVYIDSCAWDIFFRYNLKLSNELPVDKFKILMTKEVFAFELSNLPNDKGALLDYIKVQKEECQIRVDSYFGFSSYNDPEGYKSRLGGFNEGRFVSENETRFLEIFRVEQGKERKTGLYKNEADASLAVRACTGNVVLTAEDRSKGGPLKKAASEYAGKVVYLKDFDPSIVSLSALVRNCY